MLWPISIEQTPKDYNLIWLILEVISNALIATMLGIIGYILAYVIYHTEQDVQYFMEPLLGSYTDFGDDVSKPASEISGSDDCSQ